MKILQCEQRTDEWYKARLGVPTSSNFDQIITTKCEPSKSRTKYLYRLAGELVSGSAEETYQNGAMLRGCEMEGEARKLYQLIKDEIVEEVGFCLADGKYKYGASPDGLVGQTGLLEIKCPNMATHVGYLIDNVLPTAYFQQVQGQLLVTGREWVDFLSYYPGIKPFIIRVERDEKFLKALEEELNGFCNELKQIVRRIK